MHSMVGEWVWEGEDREEGGGGGEKGERGRGRGRRGEGGHNDCTQEGKQASFSQGQSLWGLPHLLLIIHLAKWGLLREGKNFLGYAHDYDDIIHLHHIQIT